MESAGGRECGESYNNPSNIVSVTCEISVVDEISFVLSVGCEARVEHASSPLLPYIFPAQQSGYWHVGASTHIKVILSHNL